jgi:hypothetical protein
MRYAEFNKVELIYADPGNLSSENRIGRTQAL